MLSSDSEDDCTSCDDDSLTCGDIDYFENREINTDILQITDDALREKLLNINLLVAKIESLSGNPTSHPDLSLSAYEAFCFDIDHTEETSSGSTTSHAYISLPEYDSFLFEEFSGELTPIITPPEYDRFYFDLAEDHDSGEDILSHESLLIDEKIPTHPPVMFLNDKFDNDDDYFIIVIKIFLPFLTYLVTSSLLHSFRNEDTIFDPGILIYHF